MAIKVRIRWYKWRISQWRNNTAVILAEIYRHRRLWKREMKKKKANWRKTQTERLKKKTNWWNFEWLEIRAGHGPIWWFWVKIQREQSSVISSGFNQFTSSSISRHRRIAFSSSCYFWCHRVVVLFVAASLQIDRVLAWGVWMKSSSSDIPVGLLE
jgi:hypothetical protein